MPAVDLNCDLGESFGLYRMGNDQAIMPFVSSVNIACGFHAGDPAVMRRTVEKAAELGVAIGAHPGLPDLQGFGRREMAVSPREVQDMVLYQVGALDAFTRAAGVRLSHVKLHGALYNMAATDPLLAQAVAEAVAAYNADLALFVPSGTPAVNAGQTAGLRVVEEAFADRGYRPDGLLAPRGTPGALLENAAAVAQRAVRLVKGGTVDSVDGSAVHIRCDTICLHGDGVHALEFAKAVRTALEEAGVVIRPAGAGRD